jgi:hypothetical protein
MSREIELLTHAASNALTVVEKATNQIWALEELQEAASAGRWSQDDEVRADVDATDVSGPFPGCLQRIGAMPEVDRYRLIGQTRHFLLFEPPGCVS